MDAIEKRAREMVMKELPNLTDESFGYQGITVVNLHVVIRLLHAALTPPEGYVLVPVEPTEAMQQAAADYLGVPVKAHGLWDAMLAACPEVKP